jgi:HD-like signal output (HDOD) protein
LHARTGQLFSVLVAPVDVEEAVALPSTVSQLTLKSWLQRLIAPRPARGHGSAMEAAASQSGGRVSDVAPHALSPLGDQTAWDLPLLTWLANGSGFVDGPPGTREQTVLQRLDHLIGDSAAHHRLLPRAAAVIVPLLAKLRSPDLSLSDLSQQVSRDMALTTEIIRMANSAFYRRDAAVVELDHAIRLLGVQGLRTAIARAALKPLIDVRSGTLMASSGARLWEHTDRKAQLCSALSRDFGFEAFEGCLAALAHNAAWSAVMRTMDEIEGDRAWHLSPTFVATLGTCRDRVFAVLARQWQLVDALAPGPAELAAPDLRADASPAMRLLYTGDRLATLLCSPDRLRATALAEALLCDYDKSVRGCFQALQSAPRQVSR